MMLEIVRSAIVIITLPLVMVVSGAATSVLADNIRHAQKWGLHNDKVKPARSWMWASVMMYFAFSIDVLWFAVLLWQ